MQYNYVLSSYNGSRPENPLDIWRTYAQDTRPAIAAQVFQIILIMAHFGAILISVLLAMPT